DITERKLAEAALKDSETQFRTLVESAPDAIFILVEGRFFVYANDAAVRLYGAASEKELLGRDIMESIHPDHRASVLKRIRLIDEEEKPIPPMELRHVKLDGTTVYVESHAVPIKYRKSKAALVFVRDITERKKNEEALSISEERYKRLFEDASMGIFRVTLEGKLIDVNPAFTLMFGFDSPEEVKSQVNDVAVDLFVDPSRRHEIVRMMLDTKRPVHAESLYGRKDGSTFMADLHAWAVRDKEGKLLYLEGFVEDISERKRAEEEKKKLERQLRQSQKLEALGTLAGGIAHDFNNILQPIIGYIEIVLLALSPSSPQRENLERVFTAALRAKDLVKQILAISRSPEEQRRTPTDISSIVKEALKLLRSSLPTSIEMRQKILKGAALADPTQIHQVLMNLCTNAAHAMDGKGILEVRLSHVDLSANDLARRSIVDLKSGPYLKLTVSDTGCGMDAETLERIFDPYFTTKEVGKGSGLGLAVVDGIVKRHEGAVTVRSETGKGTTFTIYIPRVDVESEATMQFDDLPPLGSERILLVDDDAAVMETGASLLKSLGYKVTSQTDSMKTLEVFRSTPHEFDLLITDYTMPKLTGLDLAGEVRRIRPDMPFLLCTGFSEKITHAGVKELGMELLMKPFNMVQISQAVRKILDEQKGG
ncbi:MAG: PAS domain S-box protein, partial [Syntrophobacteraceae bacterium]